MYLGDEWYILTGKRRNLSKGSYRCVDVTILQNNVLDKILDIEDPRTDNRVDFVGGIRGLEELEKRVNSGEMAAAFSLYPVTLEQLLQLPTAER
jgi:uncharacterized protein (DUF1015 family)